MSTDESMTITPINELKYTNKHEKVVPKKYLTTRARNKEIVKPEKVGRCSDKKLISLIPPKSEIDKHLHNIHTIILYTNATPIRFFNLGLGYCCQYCNNRYMNPADLKTHTLEDHDVDEKTSFMKKPNRTYSAREFIARLDVTSLVCFVCRQSMESLEKAIHHLVADHNKTLYTDIKSQIVPFNYNGEKWICVNCPMQFNTFNMIQTHMNVHYGNFQCPVCDRAYVNFKTLNTHYYTHKEGSYACHHCPKTFNTPVKRTYHEKTVHLAGRNRNKCPHCNETFADYYQRIEHMVENHGAEPLTLKCNMCEATFKTQRSLTVHVRNLHLMERKYKCKYCGKKFFRNDCLKEHLSIHSGKKEYQCDLCKKAFVRKATLKDHLRTHIEDKKYICRHCSISYVMKYSWKIHMQSKHGETVA